jgi:hypothetical protein
MPKLNLAFPLKLIYHFQTLSGTAMVVQHQNKKTKKPKKKKKKKKKGKEKRKNNIQICYKLLDHIVPS